jgi:hypothetical protein
MGKLKKRGTLDGSPDLLVPTNKPTLAHEFKAWLLALPGAIKSWLTKDNKQNIKRIVWALLLAGAVAALLFIPGLQVIGLGAAVALMSKGFFLFTHVPLLFEGLSIAAAALIPFMGNILGLISRGLTLPAQVLARWAKELNDSIETNVGLSEGQQRFMRFRATVSRVLANVSLIFFLPAMILRGVGTMFHMGISYATKLTPDLPNSLAQSSDEKVFGELLGVRFLRMWFRGDHRANKFESGLKNLPAYERIPLRFAQALHYLTIVPLEIMGYLAHVPAQIAHMFSESAYSVEENTQPHWAKWIPRFFGLLCTVASKLAASPAGLFVLLARVPENVLLAPSQALASDNNLLSGKLEELRTRALQDGFEKLLSFFKRRSYMQVDEQPQWDSEGDDPRLAQGRPGENDALSLSASLAPSNSSIPLNEPRVSFGDGAEPENVEFILVEQLPALAPGHVYVQYDNGVVRAKPRGELPGLAPGCIYAEDEHKIVRITPEAKLPPLPTENHGYVQDKYGILLIGEDGKLQTMLMSREPAALEGVPSKLAPALPALVVSTSTGQQDVSSDAGTESQPSALLTQEEPASPLLVRSHDQVTADKAAVQAWLALEHPDQKLAVEKPLVFLWTWSHDEKRRIMRWVSAEREGKNILFSHESEYGFGTYYFSKTLLMHTELIPQGEHDTEALCQKGYLDFIAYITKRAQEKSTLLAVPGELVSRTPSPALPEGDAHAGSPAEAMPAPAPLPAQVEAPKAEVAALPASSLPAFSSVANALGALQNKDEREAGLGDRKPLAGPKAPSTPIPAMQPALLASSSSASAGAPQAPEPKGWAKHSNGKKKKGVAAAVSPDKEAAAVASPAGTPSRLERWGSKLGLSKKSPAADKGASSLRAPAP